MPKNNAKSKTRTFTVFLLKDAAVPALKKGVVVSKYEVKAGQTVIGTLCVQASHARPPAWLSFFDGAIAEITEQIVNANTAAVLLLNTHGRAFAVAFGYGRNLLNPGSWEEDFGLKVTLNSVDPQRIRSVDRMSLDAIGQHSQIQASREAEIAEFGLDLEQDLLRAVTGTPSDQTLGKKLTGKDALQVTVALPLQSLPEFLNQLVQKFQSDSYKQLFPWVDQIKELHDPSKKNELDQALLKKISTQDLNRLWLTIPQLIDWSQIGGFKYRDSNKAEIHPDVHLTTFFSDVGNPQKITLELLKSRQVYAVSEDTEQPLQSWSVYRCLYCEIDEGNHTHILTNGRWYKIGADFLDRVNKAFDSIPESDLKLPEYSDNSEGDYNVRAANQSQGEYVLMDKNLIHVEGHSKVEFCDLFGKGRKLVHVKRYTGSSAPLSQLFAQAVVSGTLFKRDSEFRKKVNKLLPSSFQSVEASPKPDEYEIVFGIVSQSKGKLVVPFFSRLNLKNAIERLEELDYRISLLKIQAKEKIKKS